MKRRQFFASAGAAAIVSATGAPGLGADPSARAEMFQAGDFTLRRTGGVLSVSHAREPDRALWESPADGDFLVAEIAKETIKAFGTPEGACEITDDVWARYEHPTVDAIAAADGRVTEGDAWVDLWTGADAGEAGRWARRPAPMGMPAVFLRKNAASADLILSGLKAVGAL